MTKRSFKEVSYSKIAFVMAVLTAMLGYVLLRDVEIAFATDAGKSGSLPTVDISNGDLTISGGGFGTAQGSAWTQILTKYRGFIVGISGIAAVTMVGVFIFHFIKLASSATNPSARSQALTGLMWSGIAAAGLGGVSLIVGLFYRAVE